MKLGFYLSKSTGHLNPMIALVRVISRSETMRLSSFIHRAPRFAPS
jgi:hypothetical protein